MHIEATRWFQRSYGNTYHSVRIYEGRTQIAYVPYSYGYCDHFLQTAVAELKKLGLVPIETRGHSLAMSELGITYNVTDVKRKKDL